MPKLARAPSAGCSRYLELSFVLRFWNFVFCVLLLFCALSRTHKTFSFRLLLSSLVELHSGSSAIEWWSSTAAEPRSVSPTSKQRCAAALSSILFMSILCKQATPRERERKVCKNASFWRNCSLSLTTGSRVLQFRAFDDHSLCKFHGSLHVAPASSGMMILMMMMMMILLPHRLLNLVSLFVQQQV